MKKNIYLIRHGYALHNKLFSEIGTRAYMEYQDTPLLEEGYIMSKNLNKNWMEKNNIQLVLISPCRRTLETAQFIFMNTNKVLLSKDFLIEYPIGGEEICNKRRNLDELKYIYPNIIFDENENEPYWPEEKETLSSLNNRIQELINFISTRPEDTIAIIGHSSFFGQMKDNKIGDENNELCHCCPYKIEITYDNNNKFISLKNIE